MKGQFAQRMLRTKKSFIREILKVTQNPDVISFAGGLPNPDYFPIEPLRAAADRIFAEQGRQALQYAPTLGYEPLRAFIAQRYADRTGMAVDPDEILITNGSQQALDLVGKILIDPGDHVLMESPSYLGGIQAFTMYEPEFQTVPLGEDGVDTAVLAQKAAHPQSKLFYALPNFQNPSGITYSRETRQAVSQILAENETFLIEDDPYRELRFLGEDLPPIASFNQARAFLLGSFSKIVAPGLRMGWIYAPLPLMDKLVTAKQGTDLHSNYVSQLIIHRFLQDNDLDAHIAKIRTAYKQQRETMVAMIEECFPPEVTFTLPEGGMFLWVTLPPQLSAMDLFEAASKQNVVFVPGAPFHVDGTGGNTLRLNFSNTTAEKIEVGMTRLVQAIKQMMIEKTAVINK
ncbi:MAG: PLP-dependent aminotransferase family protein [Ardenticatenaceae bacterium]|nr:PLP-dependent aminotransferase family protein [Ardenticatenaceae bacterium]